MLVIKKDGVMEPFGIQLSNESQITLLAPTENSIEEIQGIDGELDFGTYLKNGEYRLRGIVEYDNIENKNSIIDSIVSHFISCMEKQPLIFEAMPDKMTYARIIEKPEFIPYPTWVDIRFTLKLDPFWYSTDENNLIGSGTLINRGTRETGLIVEFDGPAINPTLTIGNEVLNYNGNIPDGQKLIIDTDKETARIGNNNAITNYNGVFPMLQPGRTEVEMEQEYKTITNIVQNYPIITSNASITHTLENNTISITYSRSTFLPSIIWIGANKQDDAGLINIPETKIIEFDIIENNLHANAFLSIHKYADIVDNVPFLIITPNTIGKVTFADTENEWASGSVCIRIKFPQYGQGKLIISNLQITGSDDVFKTNIKWHDKWI